MKLTTAFLWICIFLFRGYSGNTATADPGRPQLFAVADSFFEAKEYSAAAVEYERVGFVSGEKIIRTMAIVRKVGCLKQLGLFEDAEISLRRINYEDLPDTL